MISTTLLWFLLLPILCAIALWWFVGRNKEALIVSAVYSIISMAVVGAIFGITGAVATSDTEIWNGKITNKERIHGSYVRSYECNCTTDSKGNRSCSTCYEDHYTVHWVARSTIGDFAIASADWTNRGVYALPNPARYSAIVIGEPCSRPHRYTNYVQAVPGSLFTPSAASLKAQFGPLLPKYPDTTYDIYRGTHFVTAGYSTPDAPAWNAGLAELLKERGPTKQVNAIVVIAKTADPNYVYALRDHWEGANKNDVVLVIGSSAWPKIDFAEVISWTKSELFKVELRDAVMTLGVIQREPILTAIAAQIDKNFERRRMREFEYLQVEIDPPTWLLALAVALVIGGAAGTVFVVNGKSWTPRANRFGRRY